MVFRDRFNRINNTQKLLDQMVEQQYETRERTTKQSLTTKQRNGLFEIGKPQLFHKIDQCHFGTKKHEKYTHICGNVYCNGCRNQLSFQYYNILQRRLNTGKWILKELTKSTPLQLDETYKQLIQSEYTNDDLLHITGVCGISTLRQQDIKEVLKQDNVKWKKIRYRLDKELEQHYWIESVYEYELVNWMYLQHSEGSDYKKLQIKQLIEATDKRFYTENFLFIHFHGITNCPRDVLYRVFYKDYYLNNDTRLVKTSSCGLYVQKLHTDKTLDKNIQKMCSYPFKNPYRFKHSFRGSNWNTGEYFTDEELGRMIELYDYVGGRGNRTFFRSVSNELKVWETVYETLERELNTMKLKKGSKARHRLYPFMVILYKTLGEMRKTRTYSTRTKVTETLSELIRQISNPESQPYYYEKLLRLRYEFDHLLYQRSKFEWNFEEPSKTTKKNKKGTKSFYVYKKIWERTEQKRLREIQTNTLPLATLEPFFID